MSFVHIDSFWFEHLAVRNDRKLTNELAVLPQLEAISPLGLSRIPYVLGSYHKTFFDKRLNSLPQELWLSIEKKWARAFKKKLQEAIPSHIATSVTGCAKLERPLPLDFMRRLLTPTQAKRMALEPKYLASLFISTSAMGYIVPSAYTHVLFEQGPKSWSLFAPQDIANLIQPMADMGGEMPENFIEDLATAALKKKEAFTIKDASRVLMALAVFSSQRPLPDPAESLVDSLFTQAQAPVSSEEFRYRYYLASLRLRPVLSERFNACSSEALISQSELHFKKRLYAAGFVLNDKAKAGTPLISSVDYAITCGSQTILMEYDGPKHFVRNLEDEEFLLNGSTQLMSALIRQYRPTCPLVRLPYWIGNSITSDEFRVLRKDLQGVEPNAYRLARKQDKLVLLPIPLAAAPSEVKASRSNSLPCPSQGLLTQNIG